MSEQRGGSMLKLERMRTAFDRAFRNEQNENLKKIEEANNALESKIVQTNKNLQSQIDGLLEGEFDEAALNTHIEEKLNDLEVEYAPKLTEVSTQLEETSKSLSTQPITPSNTMATIIFDDGSVQDYTVMFPFFRSKGIVGSSALISGQHGKERYRMTWEQTNEMKNYGWEFMSHTVTHPNLSTLSYEDIETELKVSKEELINKGLDIESIVYPYNFYNADVLDIVRKYYKYAFALDSDNKIYNNFEPINQYAIYRVPLEDPNSVFVSRIQEAINKKAWIVIMGHGHYYDQNQYPDDSKWPGKWDQNIETAKENIQYLIDNNVNIVTAKEAMRYFSNSITIGDDKYSESKFFLSKSGKISTNTLTETMIIKEGITNQTLLDGFENNKITISYHTVADNAGFPTIAGVCYTHKFGIDGNTSHQEWIPHDDNTKFTRLWQTWTKTWGDWVEQLQFKRSKNLILNTTTATALENKKLSYSMLKIADNAGFPTTAGTVIAIRDNTISEELTSQIFFPYNKNSIYRRRWASNDWQSWVEFRAINIVEFLNATVPQIPANGFSYVEFAISDLKVNSSITVNDKWNSFGNSVEVSGRCNRDGNLVVVIRNFSTTAIPASTKSFTVSYLTP